MLFQDCEAFRLVRYRGQSILSLNALSAFSGVFLRCGVVP